MSKPELFLSCDIETDGPIPGDYSMLSFGVVALDETGHVHDTFTENLMPLPGARQCPKTMAWWKGQPEAWEACMKSRKEPLYTLHAFVEWVEDLKKTHAVTMVCMPAGFDYMFMYWYMIKFAGQSPLSFSCIDMKTYVMATQKLPYRASSKRNWPKRWKPKTAKHTHIALDDALEQGLTFINMHKENTEGGKSNE